MKIAKVSIEFDSMSGSFKLVTECSHPLAEMLLSHALGAVQREQLATRLGAPSPAGIVKPNGPGVPGW